jgi:hypothetical protein
MTKERVEAARTVVYLGNRDAIEVLPDPKKIGATIRSKIDGPKKNYTQITLGKEVTLLEAAQSITEPVNGVWRHHSDADKPAWVAASGPLGDALAQLLGAHWGIEVREVELNTGSES